MKRRKPVRPTSCQPPGEAVGYTAACPLASATDPAGTAGRGRWRRGISASAGRQPVEIGEARREPDDTDRQWSCREPRHDLVAREPGETGHLVQVRPVERARDGDEPPGARCAVSRQRRRRNEHVVHRSRERSESRAGVTRQHADSGQAAHQLDAGAEQCTLQRRRPGPGPRHGSSTPISRARSPKRRTAPTGIERVMQAPAPTPRCRSPRARGARPWRSPRLPASRRGCTACRPTG